MIKKWIEAFLSYLAVMKNASKHTLDSYSLDLGQLASFLEGDNDGRLQWADVTERQISEFIYWAHARGLKKSSITRKLCTFRSFFKFLEAQGHIRQNPTKNISNPKLGKYLPKVLTVAEASFLVEAPLKFSNSRRDAAILEVLYTTGIRVSELTGLRLGDLDLDHGVMRISGKGRKERLAFMGRKAVTAIKAYLEATGLTDTEKPLFDITPRTVQRMIKYYAKICELGDVTPHTLRHSFATHMMNAGVGVREVQTFLGHEKISTTQIYTHVSTEEIMRTYKDAHPFGEIY